MGLGIKYPPIAPKRIRLLQNIKSGMRDCARKGGAVMARSRTHKKRRQPGHRPRVLQAPRNLARERALKALWAMRHGDSLSKAARENGVTPRTIKRYVGSALVQDRAGRRIRATKNDRLVRYLQIPGSDG